MMRSPPPVEQTTMQILMHEGELGILQTDLWQRLNTNSREGSRVMLKLERKGLVRREKVLHKGRWTFRLYPQHLPHNLDAVDDCPCFLCPSISSCGEGSKVSPPTCDQLTMWITQLADVDPKPKEKGGAKKWASRSKRGKKSKK
jgi:hypothetical protein